MDIQAYHLLGKYFNPVKDKPFVSYHMDRLNLNTCDYCNKIHYSMDLLWEDDFDVMFDLHEYYNALCSECYNKLIGE